MDILKTLIVYMVMVANGAVVASGATPIPYETLHTPTPYMTATPTPAPTLAPTLAPAAATPTPRLYLLTKGSTATENAVRDFQLRNGLKVDGKAGLQTQEKLFYAQDVVAAK